MKSRPVRIDSASNMKQNQIEMNKHLNWRCLINQNEYDISTGGALMSLNLIQHLDWRCFDEIELNTTSQLEVL